MSPTSVASVDPCGEHGEFHTAFIAGLMFRVPITVAVGEVVERDGFVFTDIHSTEQLAPNEQRRAAERARCVAHGDWFTSRAGLPTRELDEQTPAIPATKPRESRW